ncbi:MAG: cysteine rich repeat-containing protein [Candidatus Binatia bacterium]
MTRRTRLLPFACILLAGCMTQQQQLQQRQLNAEQVALQRAQFDMSCPSATATVLSSDYIQPAIQGPWVAGLTRLEYTIGVEGCGQRTTVVVMCQEGTDTCFAANPRPTTAAPMPAAPMPGLQPSPDNPVLTACKDDIARFCSNVPAGDGRVKACMKSHLSQLSEQCKETIFQAWLRD